MFVEVRLLIYYLTIVKGHLSLPWHREYTIIKMATAVRLMGQVEDVVAKMYILTR